MEQIIKVDLNDRQLGVIEKLEAHKKPILHRAFSVFLYDGDKILLQQRAFNKYHSGGLWANSCCSHPRANLSFEKSVSNRVEFELGIKSNLTYKEIFNFTYLTKYADNLFEYEFDHVLVAQYSSNNAINFNKEEINAIKWVTIADLKQDLVNNPTEYSSWFVICAPKVIEYMETIH